MSTPPLGRERSKSVYGFDEPVKKSQPVTYVANPRRTLNSILMSISKTPNLTDEELLDYQNQIIDLVKILDTSSEAQIVGYKDGNPIRAKHVTTGPNVIIPNESTMSIEETKEYNPDTEVGNTVDVRGVTQWASPGSFISHPEIPTNRNMKPIKGILKKGGVTKRGRRSKKTKRRKTNKM